MTSANSVSYTYDANGRMATRGSGEVDRYSYDMPSKIYEPTGSIYTESAVFVSATIRTDAYATSRSAMASRSTALCAASPAKPAFRPRPERGRGRHILLRDSSKCPPRTGMYNGFSMRMIIANRLNDGRVVFLTTRGGWDVDIAKGSVIEGEAEETKQFAAAKADEASCKVVDPQLIDVSVEGGKPRPVAIREAIRAFGPTI